MLMSKFIVRKNERGLLMRDGDFVRVLEPGVSRIFNPLRQLSMLTRKIDQPLPDEALVDYLRGQEPQLIERYFESVDIGEDEIGLRYVNDVLVEILPPGTRRLYWKSYLSQRVERQSLEQEYVLPAKLAAQLRERSVGGMNKVLFADIPAYFVGVLTVDGKVETLLSPGLTAFWGFKRRIDVQLVDTRLQALEVTGQEILTRDKVSLRLNLAATWRYTDVLQAYSRLVKPADHLYREMQFALREAVGTRTLDELLENKQVINEVVETHVRRKLSEFGIEIGDVGVKDIVLPGDMKTILTQVVEAEKAAQANVVRRREETAATRSLLNTAKVMEDNPTALRLKELETLERVAERIDRISVYGGLDQVLNGLVQIKSS